MNATWLLSASLCLLSGNIAALIHPDHGVLTTQPLCKSIHAFGDVRDSSGTLLTEVTCGVRTFGLNNDDSYDLAINGTFEIKQTKLAELELRFSKDGYYTSKYDIDLQHTDRFTTDPIWGRWQRSVVLWPREPSLPKLSHVRTLFGAVRDRVQLLAISSTDSKTSFSAVELTTSVRRLSFPFTELELLPTTGPLLALDATMLTNTSWQLQLKLANPGPKDGLFIQSCGAGATNNQVFPPETSMAVDTGYTTQVNVPTALLSAKPVFVFFRVTGCYGKIGLWYGKKSVLEILPLVSLDAFIQPDGTRNLRTARGEFHERN
ncbi:MAG: hypothetical protein ACR2IE_05520 [Candidatus Sumerlaeaceae bacterium]